MLTIEEYIARRKKEDRINEFDLNNKNDNLKLTIDYVFEYYNNYLNITEAEERTALHDEKLEKFRNQLMDFDADIRDWIVSIYSEHGKQINRLIGNILKQNEFFFLFNDDSDFRNVSYDCYYQLVRKHSFLKDQTEMLFQFIKDYHRIKSERTWIQNNIAISDDIGEWVESTLNKYKVNVLTFAYDWVIRFYKNEESWPRSHRIKGKNSWSTYDYDFKQHRNLFNLDSMYRRMPKKAFLRGRKQELEILMMYFYLHNIEADEEGYWDEYLKKVTGV